VRRLILFGIGGALGYIWGMLMGINQECFEVENIEDGDFHIKFVFKNKVDDFRWAFMVQHKRNTKSSSNQS
jgi:hypothetical protein